MFHSQERQMIFFKSKKERFRKAFLRLSQHEQTSIVNALWNRVDKISAPHLFPDNEKIKNTCKEIAIFLMNG